MPKMGVPTPPVPGPTFGQTSRKKECDTKIQVKAAEIRKQIEYYPSDENLKLVKI